ncbi:hypothetical protein [uncultured Dokdonia sp.]|uniref:hypothetical protein n=1 Tax=uncultured Dokdonia sp. TaxID=575653 RepID=UPI002610FEDB|nr:hypothetical protein [uncultured Dokdonia sp.]
MNIRLLILFLIASIQTQAQSTKNTTDIIQDITSEKTEKHIHIPGTRLFIIPPSGFELSNSFVGLEKEESGAIQVYDLIGGDFYSNAKTFNKENFESKRVKIYEYNEFKLNEYPSKYALLQGDPNMKAINLVFGDTTFSAMIIALYAPFDSATEKELKEAIRSIYYDKTLKIDPLATAKFTLDDNASIFKYAKSASGLILYSIDGIDKQSYENEPMVMITTLPADPNLTLKNISELMQNGLKNNGMVIDELKNISTTELNGSPAYQVEVYGTIKGEKSILYQLIVSDKEKVVSFQAVLKSEFDKNLLEVKKLAQTLKLKQ